MKKVWLFLLITVCLLTGCFKKEENIYEKVKKKYQKYEWNIDIPLENIRDFNLDGTMFITNDYELYTYSLGTNSCSKVDTDIRFNRFIGKGILSTEDLMFTYENNEIKEYSGYQDSYANLYYFAINPNDPEEDTPYVYFENGTLKYKSYDTIHMFIEEGEFETYPENEEFVGGNGIIIKSNKSFFHNADIYNDNGESLGTGLNKMRDESSLYNDIYYINGTILIFSDEMDTIYVSYTE